MNSDSKASNLVQGLNLKPVVVQAVPMQPKSILSSASGGLKKSGNQRDRTITNDTTEPSENLSGRPSEFDDDLNFNGTLDPIATAEKEELTKLIMGKSSHASPADNSNLGVNQSETGGFGGPSPIDGGAGPSSVGGGSNAAGSAGGESAGNSQGVARRPSIIEMVGRTLSKGISGKGPDASETQPSEQQANGKKGSKSKKKKKKDGNDLLSPQTSDSLSSPTNSSLRSPDSSNAVNNDRSHSGDSPIVPKKEGPPGGIMSGSGSENERNATAAKATTSTGTNNKQRQTTTGTGTTTPGTQSVNALNVVKSKSQGVTQSVGLKSTPSASSRLSKPLSGIQRRMSSKERLVEGAKAIGAFITGSATPS